MEFGYWEVTLAILIPAILYASWVDYSERRVPNWLNASLAATGLAVQAVFFWLDGSRDRPAGAAGRFWRVDSPMGGARDGCR